MKTLPYFSKTNQPEYENNKSQTIFSNPQLSERYKEQYPVFDGIVSVQPMGNSSNPD